MPDNSEKNEIVNAENNSVAVGSLSIGGNVQGNITIGNTTGYSADEVSALLKDISSTFQPKSFDGTCPYKGLDYFEEEDAELFFGREKLAEELVRRVKESRTVFITGPSGSGKSSLVRAGLIPSLKQGSIKGSERWMFATMKPGRDPIGELGRVVASLAGTTNAEDEIRAKSLTDETILTRWCEIVLKEGREKRLVLFIDQFEEVFTQISKEEERIAFLNLLTHAADVENGRVILLFSMRSDFVPNCAVYPELNATLNRQFIQIGAMQPEELVSAIAQPALRVGLRIDPDLIAQIINDMKGEPGALPLMQFALKDLFDEGQSKGGMIALTLDAYLHHGGIQKSLERHADSAFEKLDKHEQELARSIFSGLIEVGRGTQDTKRTAIFDELIPANASANEVETIVQKLADARLITTDESAGRDTVTISHEKLIDAWPWLKKLVNENRDVIALQNEIAEDAKEWEEHNRDASYLYSGARLVSAWEQLKENKITLSGKTFEYIHAGQERKRKWQAIWTGILALTFIILISAVAIFANLTQEAQNKAINAQALQLGFQSEGLLKVGKIIQAFRLKAISENALLDIPDSDLSIDILSKPTYDLNISPDGQYLATALYSKIIIWDAKDLAKDPKILEKSAKSNINSIAFLPEGKTLVSVEYDSVIFWDLDSQSIIKEFPVENTYYHLISFNNDGGLLVIVSRGGGPILLFDTKDPENPSFYASSPGYIPDGSISTAISPDGKILAIANQFGTISLWDTTNWSVKVSEQPSTFDVFRDIKFSPDQKKLVAISDNSIFLYDKNANFLKITKVLSPDNLNNSFFTDMEFNPEGSLLAIGRYDGVIQIWNMDNLDLPPQNVENNNDFLKIEWLQ